MSPQDAQDIVDAVAALLDGDKSKDVRMAVVLSLPLDTDTLPVLLQRARDVSPQVGHPHMCHSLVGSFYACHHKQQQQLSRNLVERWCRNMQHQMHS
jgi:hypothetical protein